MRSSAPGTNASEVEVTNVGAFGLWLLLDDKEYFLPYEQYPWFREARIADVLNVTLLHENHLHWPALDVDLCVESLDHPEDFPLTHADHTAASNRRRLRAGPKADSSAGRR